MGLVRRYPLRGHAAHHSGDDWQVLDRRGNPQVFGEEHRRFGDGNGRDFGSNQSDSAGARIGEDFSVGEGCNFAREFHDVVVTGHVFHREVFSAVADEDVALVLDEIRVSTVIQCSEFLDVSIGHVDAFHQCVTTDDSGVEGGQEVDGLLKLVPRTAVPLWPTDLVKHLLVGRVHRDVELGGQRVQLLEDLGQGAVGHQHRGHAVLVAQVHVFRKSGVECRLPVE